MIRNKTTFSLLCLLSPTAFAGDYVGIGYASQNIHIPDDIDLETSSLQALLGKELHKNISIEGRLGISLEGDEINGVKDINLSSYASAYAKAILPFSDSFSAHALLGMTYARFSLPIGDDGSSDSASGISYGIGTSLKVNERLQLSLEYVQVIDEEYKITEISEDAFTLDASNINFNIIHLY